MSTNHVDTTGMYSHKHQYSEINRDISASERSVKKFRSQEARAVEPQIPGMSLIVESITYM